MNVLPPAQNPALIGHEGAIEQIITAFQSGRMPHAWLITGIEGIGKATLAYHIAHYALSQGQNKPANLNLLHPVSRLIAAEAHPDLFVVQRPVDEKTGQPKETIAVEDARKIAPFLRMTATHGGWRVAIIDEAHALNRHGQNAILKVIEEPPPKCLILVTATTPGGMLPTIRSRCRFLQLQPLNENAMRAVLARCGLDLPPDDLDRLIKLSDGSPGFALRMAQTETLALFDDLMELMRAKPALDVARVHTLADKIGRKGESDTFNVLVQLLTNAMRQTVRAQALGQPQRNSITSLPIRGSLDNSLQLWDKIRLIFVQARESSLDRKLAFVNAMTEIRRAI